MKKILVVDDSDDVRENIIDLLEVNDYTVLSAANGYDGYQIAKSDHPDLIIADVMMPIMDGFEMLRQIRENNSTSTIPLILLTARSATVDMRHGMGMGADDYITKPFQSDDILNAVKTQLDKKKKIEQKFDKIYTALSSYVPHELRTPLVSILGFTKIMLEELEELNKEELKEMLLKVDSSSMRLHKTIEKFIVFAESENMLNNRKSFEQHLTKQTTILDSVLEQIVKERMITFDSGNPFTISVPETTVNILEDHFYKIVGELIENAVKFSYPKEPIEITLAESDTTAALKIKNYGRGMTEEEIAQIAPFNQHNRHVYEQSGNGLGIMIVKRFSSFYNIGFEINSSPGSFIEVSLKFPKTFPG